MTAYFALLGADVLGGATLAVLAATGVVSVTLRRGQARAKRQEAGRG